MEPNKWPKHAAFMLFIYLFFFLAFMLFRKSNNKFI